MLFRNLITGTEENHGSLIPRPVAYQAGMLSTVRSQNCLVTVTVTAVWFSRRKVTHMHTDPHTYLFIDHAGNTAASVVQVPASNLVR